MSNPILLDPTILEGNLKLFFKSHSPETIKFDSLDLSSIDFCLTNQGELNLFKKENGKAVYFHSQDGAFAEAKQLIQSISFAQEKAVFIYGIGLGYYYEVLKDWLKKDPSHCLLFLEDDLRVVYRFLQTEKAAEILKHPQVFFKAFNKPGEFDWGKFRAEFDWFFWAFAPRMPYLFIALRLYIEEIDKREFLQLLHGQFAINLSDKNEYITFMLELGPKREILNLYQNIHLIDESYNGHEMRGAFEGIPAIICGAGPSLSSQFEILKDLENRAILFAAGSGLNALSAHGISWHFAGGLDPLPAQPGRMRTNSAFMIPLFYIDGYSHEAFLIHHGPKIHLRWKYQYNITDWFMEQLGIPVKEDVGTGVSTPEFCMEIARAIGCRPLIFAGMDLAYTSSSRYSLGVRAHPLDKEEEKKQIKDISQGDLKLPGISGKEILTKWKMVLEGGRYSEFALTHPEIPIFNATEEGLPLVGIQNISLKEVEKTYLNASYDIENLIHAAIQSGFDPSLHDEAVQKVLKRWSASLEKCLDYYESAFKNGVDLEEAITQEPAYQYFLKELSKTYDYTTYLERHLFKNDVEIERKKQAFLIETINLHLKTLEKCFEKTPGTNSIPSSLIQEHASESFVCSEPLEKKKFYYSDGSLKGESHYLNGHLHGLSTVYSREGNILGQSIFINNKREGKTVQYYADGKIYSIQHFLEGKRHGTQTYFYPQGSIKAQIPYVKGTLDGRVALYYQNGQQKRELHFIHGNLNGLEREWDENGALRIEILYAHNNPAISAKQWHPNGQLAKEYVYHGDPDNYDYYEWDQNGVLIQKYLFQPTNLEDEYEMKSQLLKNQVHEILEKLKKFRGL